VCPARRTVLAVHRLAHEDTGSGPPVVLLHGLTCHLGYWRRVRAHLTGLRVVVLDFRGHGLSAHAGSYRYADYEDDLFTLLDTLGLDAAPVGGHSLGGYVALAAASRSERIPAVLAADVKSDWTEQDAAFAAQARDGSQQVQDDRDALVARVAKSVDPGILDEGELRDLAARSIEEADGGWRFRWDRRVLATEPVDPFAFLPHVRCPVHVVAGARSEVMPPASARRFADAIPGATVELVADAGHHVELQAPELVARRIRELVRVL
jgi:pimeloyl-ACP methyl ester carboxylesterase